MNKYEKVNQIRELWLSQQREIPWDQIQWDPFEVGGNYPQEFLPEIFPRLKKDGYYFWSWGRKEDGTGWLDWEWALLIHLSSWIHLPYWMETILYVNEEAMVVCMALEGHQRGLATLFHTPHARRLGPNNLTGNYSGQDRTALLAFLPAIEPQRRDEEVLAFLPKPSEVK